MTTNQQPEPKTDKLTELHARLEALKASMAASDAHLAKMKARTAKALKANS